MAKRRKNADIELLGPTVAELVPRVQALRYVLLVLLADRLAAQGEPVRASEQMIANAMKTFDASASASPAASMLLTEEIASIAHDAARLAAARRK